MSIKLQLSFEAIYQRILMTLACIERIYPICAFTLHLHCQIFDSYLIIIHFWVRLGSNLQKLIPRRIT